MKSIRISAALAGVLLGSPFGAGAVYPAYQAQTPNAQVVNMPTTNAVMQNRAAVPVAVQNAYPNQLGYQIQGASGLNATTAQTYNPNQVVMVNTNAAASPTRVTGALPRVGSNTTAAGRQYYQPADYDRLADSGLYVALSAGYGLSVIGGMDADYIFEPGAQFVPGAFETASWQHDTVIPLQVSLGAALNNDLRVDFSYTRYGSIAYVDTVSSSDGMDGYVAASVTGGAVTSNVTMLNVYYNIDSFTGYLMGGGLRPYIGAGVGLALNTISDYVVYDGTFYSEQEPEFAAPGELTAVSDVYAYHNGGTTENFAFMLEGGLTTDLGGGLKLDFFVRYANVGIVKSSGSIVVTQTEWLADGMASEYPAEYDSVYHYTNWYESGRLGLVDAGLRLRLQF